VAAAQVLNERVTGGKDSQAGHRLDATHRAQSAFQLGVVGFDPVVLVVLDVMPRRSEPKALGACLVPPSSSRVTPSRETGGV
jgi:hypothetical protein